MPREWKGFRVFLKKRDWFLVALLTFVIYIMLVILVHSYVAISEYPIALLIHVLPFLAAFTLILGFREMKEREEQERERRQKRYQIRRTLEQKARAPSEMPLPPSPPKKGEGK